MSENWKNTGVPVNNTFGNRGWGVIVNNPNITDYFREVFFEDWKPASKDSFPFTANDSVYGDKYGCPPLDFVPNRTIPTGNYSHPFGSKTISGAFNISPVLAPDTSLMQTESIIGMIKGAKKFVYAEQLYIYRDWGTYADPKPNPFLEAVINASRSGCEVKILLDSKYGKEHNEETIEYINAIAAYEGLNLEAKLIDNDAIGLNKTHNKGVIVDRSEVLISSINWNEYSPTNNREAGLIIENKDVAEFYTDVFLYDWYDGSPVKAAFDTKSGTYPSISGTHNGTITPSCNVTASKLYTYPCAGTGGHSEYVRIRNVTNWNVTASWEGYKGDWHNISFDEPFTLLKDEMYNYTIRTGSYPQIIHKQNHTTLDGSLITCEEFIDTNGKRYNDWIPAITLWA
jgi:phosphatidylserine/phosphatidylglycerophosphate/cardiolipin synthase-like enzyme